MEHAFFHTKADREAYDHGRCQAQLTIARSALQQIAKAAKRRSRSKRFIGIIAETALDLSQPCPEIVYQDEPRRLEHAPGI